MRGTGRAAFVATLLLIAGTLNIIYGIGALDNANIFTNDRRYVLDNLNTLGWVLIVLGIIHLTGGISLIGGNTYGRVIAIVDGTLSAPDRSERLWAVATSVATSRSSIPSTTSRFVDDLDADARAGRV